MQNRFVDRFWDLPNALRFSLESILSLDYNSRCHFNLVFIHTLKCLLCVLEHALMLGGSKKHYFSHNFHYYNTFLPSLTQTAWLVPGLMKARLLKNEMCCDWLAVPVRCDWREIEVSPVTLYTKQRSAHKRCFIRHYMQDDMKMTSKICWRQLVSFRNTVI